MKNSFKYYFFTIVIAFVWLANGFLCKLLGLVPRHEQIVAAILGNQYATIITKMIGLSEIALGIWILIGKYRRATVVFQIVIVLTMNVLEFLLAPHLLLWGQFNILFAILFCLLIYFYAFGIKTPTKYAPFP